MIESQPTGLALGVSGVAFATLAAREVFMVAPYRDRRDAGRKLSLLLRPRPGSAILALGPGGALLGAELAREAGAPLELFAVVPIVANGGLIVGAVAKGGTHAFDRHVIRRIGIDPSTLDAALARARNEVETIQRVHGADRPEMDLRGRTVVIVDDALTSSLVGRAAVTAVRGRGARAVVAAFAVGDPRECDALASEVDHLVCPIRPIVFEKASVWFERLEEPSADSVREALRVGAAFAPRRAA